MPPTINPLGSDHELRELMRRTASFARAKLAANPGLGVLPEDLAQEAYLHFHVNWNPQSCTALQYMCQRVKHEIDALKRTSSNRFTVYGDSENVVEFPDIRPNPEQIVQNADSERNLIKYISLKHKEASILAEWILRHELRTSREIAQYMAVTAHRIDYLKRCLRIILLDFLNEMDNEDSPARRLVKRMDGEKP